MTRTCASITQYCLPLVPRSNFQERSSSPTPGVMLYPHQPWPGNEVTEADMAMQHHRWVFKSRKSVSTITWSHCGAWQHHLSSRETTETCHPENLKMQPSCSNRALRHRFDRHPHDKLEAWGLMVPSDHQAVIVGLIRCMDWLSVFQTPCSSTSSCQVSNGIWDSTAQNKATYKGKETNSIKVRDFKTWEFCSNHHLCRQANMLRWVLRWVLRIFLLILVWLQQRLRISFK